MWVYRVGLPSGFTELKSQAAITIYEAYLFAKHASELHRVEYKAIPVLFQGLKTQNYECSRRNAGYSHL